MALFRCVSGGGAGGEITVTYGADFYGATITCTRGLKVYSKTATSSGSVEFTVDEEGDWLIESTIDGTTYSATVSVTFTSSTELTAIPDGETVLPTDDIETWLACAGIMDKSYTTLAEVLADSETYNALLGDSNACAYMKRSTTRATNLCASALAMSILGRYDVACDALLSDATWASAIANSTYFESVCDAVVPKLSSNTASVLYSTQYDASSYPAYKAFDRTNPSLNNQWLPSNGATDNYIGYDFGADKSFARVYVDLYYGPASGQTVPALTFKVQGYTNNAWADIDEFTLEATSETKHVTKSVGVSLSDTYSKMRLFCATALLTSTYGVGVNTLQFYGRTSSGEKVHGATDESAYILESGSPVTITDPSTLDAGTYTVYSRVAKDTDNLSNDYSKTIRICPNTKEIVLMPDGALYWWGYMSNDCEDITSANGWSYSGASLIAPTHNTMDIQCTAGSSQIVGIGSKMPIVSNGNTVHFIGKKTSGADAGGCKMGALSSKAIDSATLNETTISSASDVHITQSVTGNNYYVNARAGYSRGINISALWYE